MKLLASWLLGICLAWAGELKIMTEDLAPFNYEINGTLKGISVEIVERLLPRLGYPGESITLYPWARALELLESDPKAILFSTSYTPERAKKYKFACPLLTFGIYFYKKKGASITLQSLEDVKKVNRIGVVKHFKNHEDLLALGFTNIDLSSHTKTALVKLLNGRVDLVPTSEIELYGEKYSDLDLSQFENTGLKFYDSQLCIAFNTAFPDAEVTRWQSALEAIHASGEFAKIYTKYIHK